MARARDHQDRQDARQERREERSRGDAGLFRRLSRHPGRDRGRKCARIQALWRAEFRCHPVPQRQRGGNADDLATRHARAQGLDLIFLSMPQAAVMEYVSLSSFTWFGLALILFAVEALRPGRFALWLGFAA